MTVKIFFFFVVYCVRLKADYEKIIVLGLKKSIYCKNNEKTLIVFRYIHILQITNITIFTSKFFVKVFSLHIIRLGR